MSLPAIDTSFALHLRDEDIPSLVLEVLRALYRDLRTDLEQRATATNTLDALADRPAPIVPMLVRSHRRGRAGSGLDVRRPGG